jgi:alpha-beta hydrolase superfamily lysophospholipase
VLGAGWSATTLELPPDRFGPAVATLVRRDPTGQPSRRAVLHVHGFTDYFFQRHLGDAFAADGWDFYALDLRDYGRSTRPGREPEYTPDIAVYAQELDRAVDVLRADHDVVVVHAHSAGGLVVPLWLNERPGLVDALVLNSPWLDLKGSRFERGPLTAILDVVGRVAPRLKLRVMDPYYGHALHCSSGGEWDYDLTWKPYRSFPVRAGWVRSIRAGHRRVARGLHLEAPVLVVASAASGPGDHQHDALLTTDVILDVRDMVARAPRLGPDVTLVQIPGGAHDLVLSPEPARGQYLTTVLRWLDERVPTRPSSGSAPRLGSAA